MLKVLNSPPYVCTYNQVVSSHKTKISKEKTYQISKIKNMTSAKNLVNLENLLFSTKESIGSLFTLKALKDIT